MSNGLSSLLWFIAILALIPATLWFLKRTPLGGAGGAGVMKSIASLPLSTSQRIVTVEMNDQGIYGFGQLAMILRARYCESKITSFTKTDGLTFRVKEILDGVFKGKSFAARFIPRDGAAVVHEDTSAENVKTLKDVVPQGVG